jgi:hypothetical protein
MAETGSSRVAAALRTASSRDLSRVIVIGFMAFYFWWPALRGWLDGLPRGVRGDNDDSYVCVISAQVSDTRQEEMFDFSEEGPTAAGVMPNKRNPNVARITVTLASQMLEEMELAAQSEGTDRLQLIRKALKQYLENPKRTGRRGNEKK